MNIMISDKIKANIGKEKCVELIGKFEIVVAYFEFMFGFKKTTKVIFIHDHEFDDNFVKDRDVYGNQPCLNLDVRMLHGDAEAVWSFGYGLLRDLFMLEGSALRKCELLVYEPMKGLTRPEHDMCVAAGILSVDVSGVSDIDTFVSGDYFSKDRSHGLRIANRCDYSWRKLRSEAFG